MDRSGGYPVGSSNPRSRDVGDRLAGGRGLRVVSVTVGIASPCSDLLVSARVSTAVSESLQAGDQGHAQKFAHVGPGRAASGSTAPLPGPRTSRPAPRGSRPHPAVSSRFCSRPRRSWTGSSWAGSNEKTEEIGSKGRRMPGCSLHKGRERNGERRWERTLPRTAANRTQLRDCT